MMVAPFAGAWIEIVKYHSSSTPLNVAPFAGAWIEILVEEVRKMKIMSHPSRVRGLKYQHGRVCR